MEDTKSLLMMVLHKIFQNQPKTIENTFQLIHSFNNGKIEKKNYEKTLKTICDLMNDQLPSPILVYILTLVDMPQEFESQSPIVEKMRRTHDFLPEMNVRPHLLEYLNNCKSTFKTKPAVVSNPEIFISQKEKTSNENSTDKNVKTQNTNATKPVSKILRRTRKLLSKRYEMESPKKLVDICASYVVRNEPFLKEMYKKNKNRAWKLINSNMLGGSDLEQCYDAVKDLNKKSKWLREFESDNISTEIMMEEYKNSEVFFMENRSFPELFKDPFTLSTECEEFIDSIFQP